MSTITQELDPDAIYRTHVRQVGRWVLRLGGPGIDVEDTVHDVFAIAFRRLSGFRGDSSMATWLFGITDRVVSDRRRKPRWWRRPSGSAEETAGALPAQSPNPFESFEKAQAARSVYQVLDQLAEGDRRILILFELEDLSADQVGDLLGIKAANARLRLHRARPLLAHVPAHVPFVRKQPSEVRKCRSIDTMRTQMRSWKKKAWTFCARPAAFVTSIPCRWRASPRACAVRRGHAGFCCGPCWRFWP